MKLLKQDDLTVNLCDSSGLPKYAVFLPAISGFYTQQLGSRRDGSSVVDSSRIPSGFENGIAGMNYMDKKTGYFYYPYNLYSAGHANLDISKPSLKEDILYNRDKPNNVLVGDSGGFQIGKGVWQADWKDPNCPRALSKRQEVLSWLDHNFDYAMILDIPAWVRKTERGRQSSGISTFAEAIKATQINNEYFIANRKGIESGTKFLNVMQGSNHAESLLWFDQMKKYCDPKQYKNHFNGWALGSQQACDPHLTLRRLIDCKFQGLLEKGIHDWVHVLGNSNMEWVLLLSDLQRSIRKHHNANLTISYDAASPFLAAVNGQMYYNTIGKDPNHWTFPNGKAIDNKKYASDTRTFKQVAEQDGYFKHFEDSPITKRLKINDVCHYAPGALNKLGKEGNKSWDSFSYALIMSHNVWTHIKITQMANEKYDGGVHPAVMSTVGSTKKGVLLYDKLYAADIIDDIWATSDYSKAIKLIDHYSKYWLQFRGVRGNFGKKAKNSLTAFNHIFQEV